MYGKDLILNNGILLVSIQTYTETVAHNFTLNPSFDEIDHTSYDGLWLPGGSALEYLADNADVLELVDMLVNSGQEIIACICHGHLILAAANLLEGCKCTTFPPLKPVLIAASAYCGGTDLQALWCHIDAVCLSKKAGDTWPTAAHDFEGDQIYSEKPGTNFALTATFDDVDPSSDNALVIEWVHYFLGKAFHGKQESRYINLSRPADISGCWCSEGIIIENSLEITFLLFHVCY